MSVAPSNISDIQRIRPAAEKRTASFSGLLTNKILSALPGDELTRLLPYLEPASFRLGEYVYELGQHVPVVYFPEAAVISQIYYLEDGSSAGVSIVGNDGLLGLSAMLDAPRARYWAVATIGGSALGIRVDVLRQEFMKGGVLQKLILSYANARMVQLAQRTVCNSRHRLEERLCTWLLMIHDRANNSNLPLTHEAISQLLGTRRAGVTNFCNVLRDNRVISYHRALITILNREALEASACECYRRIE